MELLTSRTSMKITDLSFDCLESCLRHLSIEELLNVADSNTELKQVARYIFGRMYQQETVFFSGILKFQSENHGCKCNRLRFEPTFFLSIHEFKLCLQFLRCFGDFVSDIDFKFCNEDDSRSSSKNCPLFRNHTIQYDRANELEPIIIEYINNFCADSLITMRLEKHYFENVNCDLDKLIKPFKNVEILSGNIIFKTQLKLHELFPKVRHLGMQCSDNNLINKDIFLPNYSMANSFPYLEYLVISIDHGYKYNKENLAIALSLSTKIKSLRGNVWFEVLFDLNNFRLWNRNEHLQNLESLDLEMNFFRNPHLNEILKKPFGEDLHLRNLKQLNIKVDNACNRDVSSIFTFPFTGYSLESLNITANNCKFKRFSNLLDKHPTVKKFNFAYNKTFFSPTLEIDDCTRISKAFPMLEEIFFETTPENVIRTIEMFPSLKYFRCYMRHIQSIADSEIRSFNGWSVSSTLILNTFPDVERLVQGKRKN